MAILTEAPAGANVVDLDQARAARAEARALSGALLSYVKLDAGYIPLNPDFDLFAAEDLIQGRIRDGLGKLLNDPADVEVLVAHGLSLDDVKALIAFVTGKTVGESSASSTPSESTSESSRPTSPASTEPTSETSAGVPAAGPSDGSTATS